MQYISTMTSINYKRYILVIPVTDVLPTELIGSSGTDVHSSDATDSVASSLADAQNKCETV